MEGSIRIMTAFAVFGSLAAFGAPACRRQMRPSDAPAAEAPGEAEAPGPLRGTADAVAGAEVRIDDAGPTREHSAGDGAAIADTAGIDSPGADIGKPDDDAEDLLYWGRQLSLRAWTGLMDAECDVETFGVWTPIEARVLRHVPLVLHGHAVDSADLRAFFEHDGVGARSPDGAVEPIPADERTCMDRLRQRERALRVRMPVPSEVEPLFTTPCAFWAWRGWAYLGDPPDGPYAKTRRWDFFRPEPGGGWRWQATHPDPACTSGAEECGGYVIIAYPDGTCEAVAAG
ncbi:MAG: hypothetical protein HY905_18955 [Deltaproteobacteria bacterium]|nr:hypothetical protein [Deltaproteobacteria bacterium]